MNASTPQDPKRNARLAQMIKQEQTPVDYGLIVSRIESILVGRRAREMRQQRRRAITVTTTAGPHLPLSYNNHGWENSDDAN